jgi:peptidoglycan hydrolase-like amidase
VDGHGNGHGIGMPQYGAYGYALKTRHTYPYILAHYYPGTGLRRAASHTVRVLLKQGPALLVAGATRVTAPGRSAISLRDDRTYRFEPDAAGLRLVDTSSGQALDAQAVAARSYALRSLKPAASPFDVYADTRSQVYRGLDGERSRTTSAVQATRAYALFYGTGVAATYFSSSSGGRTAAIDEEWGGPPVPYLRSVSDPYDYLSPWHSWTLTLKTADVQQRLGSLLLGDLRNIAVVARNSSGRAALVEITGSGGVTEATGVQIRAALGLRSTWFTLRFSH